VDNAGNRQVSARSIDEHGRPGKIQTVRRWGDDRQEADISMAPSCCFFADGMQFDVRGQSLM